jgi:hypothetical protein
MTTQTSKTLNFGSPGKGRGWKDAFVVSFLAIVLGAFVAQISTSHRTAPPSQPVAAAASATTARG